MSGKKPAPKLNSYSLLQMKMKEVEKSRNPGRPPTKSSNSSSSNSKEESKEKNPPQRKSPPPPDSKEESKGKKPPQRKSPPPPDPSKEQHRLNPNMPDRSFGDYFCKICDSHMNSDAMWEAHTTGKRHIKNVKKGDTDSKYDELDEESSIMYELQNVKDPIIGLNYIHEIRRKDPNIPAMYNCFLCHASIATVPLVVEHVTGLKHRLNFIKENETEEYDLLESTHLKKNLLDPLAAETAARLEAKLGRGEVKVKVEKPKPAIPYKRSYDSDDDDRVSTRKASKPNKPEEKVPVWSSLDIPRRGDRENRRRETDYYDNRNSRSYRNSVSPDRGHSRRSERAYADDYPSRSISHPSDYMRSEMSEFSRHSYDRSPDRDRLPSSSTRKDDYYTSSFASSRHESVSHSFKTQMESNDQASMIKDFLYQVKKCPNEFFLKIVLMKLQDMSDLNRTEQELLMKVFTNSQQVICNNLPPQMQILFKDRMIQPNAENIQASRNAANSSTSFAARPRMPQGGQSTEDMSNKFVNDINELLFGARKASETSSSDNHQTRSSVYDRSPNIAPASSQYSGTASANFPPPPSFQPQSSNFVPPPSNFPSVSNNFQPPPARFQPPPANFPPPLNEFTSQTNNPPNDFISKSNNAISTYSSYAPYDTSSLSSGIPGLTLTERDKPQNQNYSQYKWRAPNSNNRDMSNFRRY